MSAVSADGLVLSQHYEGSDSWLEVVTAMPRAMFSRELLTMIRRGEGAPGVTLDQVDVGGILRIRARDRTLVYKLTGQTEPGIYFGEWPD